MNTNSLFWNVLLINSVLPFPDLTPVRDMYRFMFCLMEIKGPSFDYDKWLSVPHYFNTVEKVSDVPQSKENFGSSLLLRIYLSNLSNYQ